MVEKLGALSRRQTAYAIEIQGKDEVVIITARGATRELARELGFGVVDQTRIATAVSEVVRNVVEYAGSGRIELRVLERGSSVGLEIIVRDKGPGIDNIERVLQGGYSTGHGFGRGIAGARALMDEFDLKSQPGRGTEVWMRKWIF